MEQKSLTLHITNFVRPFTLAQARSMIEETCSPVFFWMDSIKSQCYIELSNAQEAEATYAALQNRVWPVENGSALKVAYVPKSELPKKGEFSR